MPEVLNFEEWISNQENIGGGPNLACDFLGRRSRKRKTAHSDNSSFDTVDSLARGELKQVISRVEDFLKFLLNDEAGKEFIHKKKNRIRLIGYFLNGCFRITCDSDRSPISGKNIIEELLAQTECDDFDYEKEIADQKWVVPLTGNLYVDAMTNFYSRNLEDCDLKNYVSRLFVVCVGQYMIYSAHVLHDGNGPLGGSLFSAPCNEQQFRNIIGMVSGRNGTRQSENGPKINLRAALIATYFGRNSGWKERCIRPLHEHTLSSGRFSYYPAEQIIDTRAIAPEKAWCGVHFDGCMSPKFRQSFSSKDSDIVIDWETENNIRIMSHLAALYNNERDDLKREKKRIAMERKARKEQEKTILQLTQQLQAMTQKVSVLSIVPEKSTDMRKEADKVAAKLSARIAHLEARAEKTQKARDEMAGELEKAKLLIESLKTEVSTLQKIAQEREEPENTSEEIDASVFDDLFIVIYGGFPAWEKGMSSLHPNIVIFGSQSPMPLEQIAKADAVWLQTNCMSHAQFDRISTAVSISKTPLRYFTHAGHAACKKQILEETRAMFRPGDGMKNEDSD